MTSTASSRAQAARLLSAVLEEGRTLDEAVAQAPLEGDEADTRFVMMLVLTVLRHLGQVDVLLTRYVAKPLPTRRRTARQALRLGAAQLLLMDTRPHAAVNETVELVKRSKDGALAGLVNAVLQKIAREKPKLPDASHNLPAWLRARWEGCYGKEAVTAMAETAAERPPLDLHLPAPATLPEGARLDETVWRLPPDHMPVTALPGFAEGAFFVQDVAASQPARLLGEVKGLRVLDLCAAPGGKAAQLAKAGAHVTALDRSPPRLALLTENMQRLRLDVETVTADLLAWHPAAPYDAILLDAPCSATGTWRKHPEVVHLVTPAAIAELAVLQRKMLARAWPWLKPGGRLVYCVCSLEREEGEEQAEWFRDSHADADPGEARRTFLHAIPGGQDGFFMAAFTKKQ